MNKLKIKYLKIILLSTLGFLVFISIAIVSLFYFFPTSKIREIIIEKIKDSIECHIEIGDITYGFRGVSLKNVILSEDDSPDSLVLMSANEIAIWFNLIGLLKKKFDISHVFLDNFKITFSFSENGEISLMKYFIRDEDDEDESKPGKFSINVDTIKLSNSTIIIAKSEDVYAPLEGGYTFEEAIIEPRSLDNIIIRNCILTLSDSRGTLRPRVRIQIDDERFLLTGNTSLDKASLLWVYKWADNPLPQPYHLVTGDVTGLKVLYHFKPKDLLVEGNVKGTSTVLNSRNIVNATGSATVKANIKTNYKSLLLSNVRGKVNTSTVVLNSLHYLFREDEVTAFSASNINAQYSHIRDLLRFLPKEVNGRVTGSLSMRRGVINANLGLSNISYDTILTNISTNISIVDNVFTQENIKADFMGYPCTLSVASVDKEFKTFFANLHTNRIVLKDEKSTEAKPADAPQIAVPSGSTTFNIPLKINGNITINQIEYGNIRASDIGLNYAASGKTISVNRMAARIFGGNLSGSAAVTSSGKLPHVSSKIIFTGIRVQDVANLHPALKDRVFGIASGEANLNFLYGQSIFKSLKGDTEVNIDSGKFVDTGIQNGLGLWLSDLQYKLKNLEFNRIYGNVTFNNDTANINSFVFNSDDVRLRMAGAINTALVTPHLAISLEFTRRFLRDIPTPAVNLGLDKYLRNNWYIIPFTAQGDISEGKNIKRDF